MYAAGDTRLRFFLGPPWRDGPLRVFLAGTLWLFLPEALLPPPVPCLGAGRPDVFLAAEDVLAGRPPEPPANSLANTYTSWVSSWNAWLASYAVSSPS